ncbi:hypothetical protein [Flavobacterium terrigena]|uniref:Uncharacterized protein n=1 Tax=Flavobacterium terrigena TaxID=402734 RepID=A0A1H6UY09_9FLAO|nr:hypothetical protein [Flavobacterium terrigena]SEI93240.1 hypothetical protein SAMN05660918_1960 [Flavobacterium terrigena]
MKHKKNVQKEHKIKTTSYLKLPSQLVEDVKALNLSKENQSYSFKFIGIILRNNFNDYKDLFEETAIPIEYIKKSFNDKNYQNWLKPLLDNNIIIRNDYYSKDNNTCYNYSINSNYFINNLYDNYIDKSSNVLCVDNQCKPLSIVSYRDIIKLDKEDILHLNYFKKDIEQLNIDYTKLEEIIQNKIDSISIESFATNEKILDEIINLTINKSSIWMKRENAIAKAKEMNMVLIKDNKRFVIAAPEAFISTKKQMIDIMYNQALMNLKNGNYRAKRNQTNNRLDTNFTNMCSKMVDEICNQNNLIQIDLKNSQFAILSFMLQDKLHTSDFKLFKELSASGKLYEYIKDNLDLKDRKEGKNAAFEILFSSHKNTTANKKKLQELFQTVIAFIDNYKKENGDNNFAIKLQLMESKMFIDDIFMDLKKKKFFGLTKHDSVIVKAENEQEILELITAYFKAQNFDYELDIKKTEIVSNNTSNEANGTIELLSKEEISKIINRKLFNDEVPEELKSKLQPMAWNLSAYSIEDYHDVYSLIK